MSKKGIGRGLGRRQFALEQLESRNLLAGEVNAVKDGENLNVTGDTRNNVVAIVDVGNDRFAVIGVGTGLKGTNPTTNGYEYKIFTGIRNINVDLKEGNDALAVGNDAQALVQAGIQEGVISSGSASSAQSALESFLGSFAYQEFQLDKQLKIRMNSGNDDVLIVDADIGRRIDADLGNGNNSFIVDPTEIGDDLILRAGSGTDYVSLADTDIAQMLDVNLGDGANYFEMYDSDITDDIVSEVGESVVLHTGKHNDEVYFDNTDVDLDFIIRTNQGHDIVEYTGFTGFTGPEGGFIVDHAVIGHVADINTGSGNDEVEVCDADIGIEDGGDEIGWSLKINTEDGMDSVFVGCEGSIIGPLQVRLPEFGNFDVNIGDDLLINLGSGNDGFDNAPTAEPAPRFGAYVQNTGIVDNFEVHGGSGYDNIQVFTVGVGHDAFINGNDGNDRGSVQNMAVGNNMFVDLSGGHDRFQARGVLIGNDFHLDAGSGDDQVELAYIFADKFFANMGSDDDGLAIQNIDADEEFRVDGGSDYDELYDYGGNDDYEEVNFEDVFTP